MHSRITDAARFGVCSDTDESPRKPANSNRVRKFHDDHVSVLWWCVPTFGLWVAIIAWVLS